MKKILLPSFLLLSLISTNAFATHIYRTENCKSKTHDLVYEGNYPVGGMYGISLAGQDNSVSALPLFDSETRNTLEDASVIFKTRSSKLIELSKVNKDCGFDHEEWKSETVIEINSITADSAAKLNLKQGDKLTFICEESADFPNGSECK